MITNERQYKITRAQAERFRKTLADLERNPAEGIHPLVAKAERDGLASQLEELDTDVAAYEALKAMDVHRISISSFDELANGLIRARIASGISQRDLAERLGLKEQQIQRYESERYESASYRRLQEIAGALGVRINNDLLLPITPITLKSMIQKTSQIGLDREFLLDRLLPPHDAAALLGLTKGEDEAALLARVGAVLSRVFGWNSDELFGAEPLTPPRISTAEARFKMPANRSVHRTGVYAAYANYLAMVVLAGSKSLKTGIVPQDAGELRRGIVRQHGDVSLLSILEYAWDIGIPVLPLSDPGAFHGACWRYGGRNIIVLKQRSPHESRWVFDLLHEIYHAGQQPDRQSLEVLEGDETSDERRNSSEEIAASKFAGNILLDGRAEELTQMCVDRANGAVPRLKSAVQYVAEEQDVPVGALANYLAFRLSWQHLNWWGAAHNLQGDDNNPLGKARDVFARRFPFTIQTEFDRALLQRAFQ